MEINNDANYISINDSFWIQIKNHLISFSFKGIPKNIHFTIGFDKRSSNINLHITKNTGDNNNKPKITIVEINKTVLKEDFESLIITLLDKILLPFNINDYKNEFNNELTFISLDKLQKSEYYSKMPQMLIHYFEDIVELKKRRLKIKGDIKNRLDNFAQSTQKPSKILKIGTKTLSHHKGFTDCGYIVSKEDSINVIRIGNNWFTLKKDLNISDLLEGILEPKLVKDIIYRIKKALVLVKNSETFEDTRQYNDESIHLVRPYK